MMIKARRDGLYLLLLGIVVFLLFGAVLENSSPASMMDFKSVYYPGRCLVQHCDPYQVGNVLHTYQAEAGGRPALSANDLDSVTRLVYLPTALPLTVPFALLPWGPASMLWMALTVASLILATFLIWDLGANYSPLVAGALIGFLFANCELLAVLGNAAGIAVSFCAIAVWCFLKERFVWAGILCLSISLLLKPQDAGLVWLYLLLAGGVFRRRALQTLALTMMLGLPGILWVWHVAPNWLGEWRSNIAVFSAHGGLTDPALASMGQHGIAMMINLQTVVCYFWNDPRIYNPVTYVVCGALLLVWIFATLRSRFSPARAWLAIAAIAALSLLPTYHRTHDAKLLLLTVPACAMLWAEDNLIGRLALLLNGVGFVVTADLPWAIFFGFISARPMATTGLSGQVLIAVQVFSIPLILLVMSVFYLWVYVRRCSAESPTQPL